jgi:hypothetical protein
MNTRLTAAIVAGALAIGVLVGAAGSIVIGDAVGDDTAARQDGQMGSMMEMMGADMGSMTEMMSGSGAMGPGAHDAHHPDSDQ